MPWHFPFPFQPLGTALMQGEPGVLFPFLGVSSILCYSLWGVVALYCFFGFGVWLSGFPPYFDDIFDTVFLLVLGVDWVSRAVRILRYLYL
jgi:hypothetical protein